MNISQHSRTSILILLLVGVDIGLGAYVAWKQIPPAVPTTDTSESSSEESTSDEDEDLGLELDVNGCSTTSTDYSFYGRGCSATDPSATFDGAFTVEMWVMFPEEIGGPYGATIFSVENRFILRARNAGNPGGFSLSWVPGPLGTVEEWGPSLSANVWYYVAVTSDADGNYLVWLDGESAGLTGTFASGPSGTQIEVGACLDCHYPVQIEELRISSVDRYEGRITGNSLFYK